MMPFADQIEQIVTEREPMATHTWFGLGGPAEWFARPRSMKQLSELMRHCHEQQVPVRILGLGANLLVCDDGVDGVVVRLNSPEFREVRWDPDTGEVMKGPLNRAAGEYNPTDTEAVHFDPQGSVVVTAAGGVEMAKLTLDAVRRGLTGLECMAGIPGTLGGIVRMNAGGRTGQISDVVQSITMLRPDGSLCRLSREQAGFAYRSSRLGEGVVCQVTMELRPDDPREIRERYMSLFEMKRRSQPMQEYCAGCVFKNPPQHSAGALIDKAGFKGRAVGGAWVSERHANFIVAKEGATAGDVLSLIGLIRREVADRFGVELELEIEVWGKVMAGIPA